MAAALLAALVQLLTLAANVSAMWKMRAEMATTPEDKKAALDQGLRFSDMAHDIQSRLDWLRRRIADLKDDDPAPTISAKPAAASTAAASASTSR